MAMEPWELRSDTSNSRGNQRPLVSTGGAHRQANMITSMLQLLLQLQRIKTMA